MDTVVSKDNDFNDFDDLSEHKSLKGNLEMYDYGEDFDCGDEENGKKYKRNEPHFMLSSE